MPALSSQDIDSILQFTLKGKIGKSTNSSAHGYTLNYHKNDKQWKMLRGKEMPL